MRMITLAHLSWVAGLGMLLGWAPGPASAQQALDQEAPAQGETRQVITPAAYDRWNDLVRATLSADGQWVAYAISSGYGHSSACELVVRHTSRSTAHRFPGDRCPQPAFTADSRFVVFPLVPSATSAGGTGPEVDTVTSRRSPPALGILALGTGRLTTVPDVPAFTLSRGMPAVVAYQLPEAVAGAAGTSLMLRTVATGQEVRLEHVTRYAMDERGTWLVYVVAAPDSIRDGVYVRSLRDGRTTALVRGSGTYTDFVFNQAGTQLAFLAAPAVLDSVQPGFTPRRSLYLATLGPSAAARRVVAAEALGDTLQVASTAPAFTRAGDALLFGVAPVVPAAATAAADSSRDSSAAIVELWHFRAPFLPPARAQAGPADRWMTAIYWPDTDRWVRLGTSKVPRVRVSADAQIGLAVTSAPYALQSMWGEVHYDVYTVTPRTGHRTLVRRATGGPDGWFPPYALGDALPADVAWSPSGKYLLVFERGRWWSQNLVTGQVVDLTGALAPVQFNRETSSLVDAKPWGIAGWTPDDARVLIYDEFDIWAIDPAGAEHPRRVTDGLGRRIGVVFRVLEPGGEGGQDLYEGTRLDPGQPLLLTAENLETRETGFWRVRLDRAAPPTRLTMAPARLKLVAKAADAERYLLTRESYREYPDLWTTDRLDAPAYTRLTHVQPQQAEYRWGTAELVHFTSTTGQRLAGVLYKPEDFDSTKQYPLLVSIYEQQSHRFHEYERPEANGANITPVNYVSRGYLVLRPDIDLADRSGRPCARAMASVVPAVQALVARGFVHPKRVGVTGHSFGGYETMCLVARTGLFRAASAANGIADLVSFYGTFRPNGSSWASWAEAGQGRLAVPPWEARARHVDESPIFHVQHITTPLLVLHSDGDDVVPWEQSLELFAAMRRLGKEMYLVNYPGEDHQLYRRRANVLDWDRRHQEFFDYYLMDGPRPRWMDIDVPTQRAQPRTSATTGP